MRCTQERSQLQNKEKAMALLKAKLLVIAQEQRAAEIADIRGDIVEAAWGNQIRNYVFHLYQMVKDLRTRRRPTMRQAAMSLASWIRSFRQAARRQGVDSPGHDDELPTMSDKLAAIANSGRCPSGHHDPRPALREAGDAQHGAQGQQEPVSLLDLTAAGFIGFILMVAWLGRPTLPQATPTVTSAPMPSADAPGLCSGSGQHQLTRPW